MKTEYKIRSFEDLTVWQRALDLSVFVYKLSAKFPKEETFSLTNQIRRAANSVSLNVSEGSVKTTRGFINQLKIANGSASEVLSAAILAQKLDFVDVTEVEKLRSLVAEITKMLNSLISSLEERIKKVAA